MQITIQSVDHMLQSVQRIIDLVCKGLAAGPVVITFGRESKSRAMEEKYHAMIGDFVPVTVIDADGIPRKYDAEVWKALCLRGFDMEMKDQGNPLTHPGRRVTVLDGSERMYIRPTSTKFTKQEASDFIEYLYAAGSEHDVKWSEKALAVYAEYRGAQ